ncbi:DUF3298 domain-containing protein [Mycolicibacterium sp. J2]|uniref:DUF3298 domain-containing protein n=1 Tax=Mycolicibacterium sp. J2 TaxID=2993511 RepID=UPI00224AB48C|nr:DUF3298 domain-containing protein [Mycolicibacterium sp. J2]MCX2714885.1 DUF3298 domain-containing protein [Mycolicibacterium sp. J2]
MVVIALAALIAPQPVLAIADEGAPCDRYIPVTDTISTTTPDQLGNAIVRYERVAGGDPEIAHSINEVIDAEARGQVATYGPSGSKTLPWTLNVQGKLAKRPVTISALFTGEYTDPQPNMPFHAIATRVFDCRSGALIDWDNLFLDKKIGLARLAQQTTEIIPTIYAPPAHPGVWQFGSEVAPIDANYRYWIPSNAGIELHFPDWQFGRGVTVLTVPWSNIDDLIVPELRPII